MGCNFSRIVGVVPTNLHVGGCRDFCFQPDILPVCGSRWDVSCVDVLEYGGQLVAAD